MKKIMLSAADIAKGILSAEKGLSPDLAREIAKSTIDHALGKHPADGLSSAISTSSTLADLAAAIAKHKNIPLAEAQILALRLSSSQDDASTRRLSLSTTVDELAASISAKENIPLAEAQCAVFRLIQQNG